MIKKKRCDYSVQMLNQLSELSPSDVIISDESWFCFNYEGDSMWVRDKNELTEVAKQGIGSKKVMISMFLELLQSFLNALSS